MTLLLLLTLIFLLAQSTSSTTRSPLEKPSATLDALNWNKYHNYSEIVETLQNLNATYPDRVDLFTIGESVQGKPIYCMRLTNETRVSYKPKVLFIGYHHAREPITAELALYFTVHAATNYGSNTTITNMMNKSQIYIIVALNVDGFDAFANNDWQRKNLQPIDEDYDSQVDEDPPEDEDGDGIIELQWNMTLGEFIRWEGWDNDADGSNAEDWLGGVDLNRNYGYAWDYPAQSGSTDPTAEDYKGSAPFSEPETQALRDFTLQHSFKYAISFHSGTEVILYPWGYVNGELTPDDRLFRDIAGNLSQLTGAPYEQSSELYTCSGLWEDWMYGNRSTMALTCEIFGNNSAWHFEPGSEPDTMWEGNIKGAFNPDPQEMEEVIQRWMPVFFYLTNRAISELGDVNRDGRINSFDLALLVQAYLAKPSSPNWNPKADFNENRIVDLSDLVLLAKNYGKSYSYSTFPFFFLERVT